MSTLPIKCASNKVNTDPFYLVQERGTEKRWVAVFRDKEKIRSLLLAFAHGAREVLRVTIVDVDDPDRPVEYSGEVPKEEFPILFDKFSELILHDGYHDLVIHLPENDEQLAFDQHGLLFIYSQNDYSKILEQFGLAYKNDEPLIYEVAHWHYRPANGREDLKKLVAALGLTQNNQKPGG